MLTARSTITRNAYFIVIMFISIWALFCIRLGYLQLYKGQELHERAQKNYTRFSTIPPIRGNIFDANGLLLATNRPVIDLYWSGSGNKKLSSQQLLLIDFLANLFPRVKSADLQSQLMHAEKYRKRCLLARDIARHLLSQIAEKFPEHPNLLFEKTSQRYYPYKEVACHVIGYISNMHVDQQGKMGLEKILEPMLKGQEGKYLKIIDSVGSDIVTQEVQKALGGQNIYTTIDFTLQSLSEEIFDNSHKGAFIIMDPEDGAIKTLISRPSFDPNLFLQTINQQQWISLQEHKPFLNRAFNACYPPASIFKLVSLSAALELGIVQHDDTICCKGYTLFCGRKYHCARRAGHGILSIQESLATSCNILFYEIGKKLSINTLADYAYRFGLGKKTNIIFQEKAGLVPSSSWKYAAKKEAWWAGETLHACIGQGYLLATPIQICRMIASIFTGYLVNPRLLVQEEIIQEPLNLEPYTQIFLKKSMKSVITRGTGKHLNKIKDIKVYAKTGTAQIGMVSTHPDRPEKLEHAWFVAYIKSKKNRPIVLVLLVEHAGSSKVATSIAKRFLMRYRVLLNEKTL